MSERLDRIERTLELTPTYRIEFREQYKFLLNAQVQMQRGPEDLRRKIDSPITNMESMR